MNQLYPIFLKVNQLNVLIIGAGKVGHEKLGMMLKSSPEANVRVIAKTYSSEILAICSQHKVSTQTKAFEVNDLTDADIVIAATNDIEVNKTIYQECKKKKILVNVADTPTLCDFYLGGIVTKGELKVAISTNGKSPTAAKRLRQFFEQILPDSIDELLLNLNTFRSKVGGSLESKVSKLNKLTKEFIQKD